MPQIAPHQLTPHTPGPVLIIHDAHVSTTALKFKSGIEYYQQEILADLLQRAGLMPGESVQHTLFAETIGGHKWKWDADRTLFPTMAVARKANKADKTTSDAAFGVEGLYTEKFIQDNNDYYKPPCPWLSDRYTTQTTAEAITTLNAEITRLAPSFIICMGGAAYWALTGNTPLENWRGTVSHPEGMPCPVIGTFPVKRLTTQPESRWILQADLDRAVRVMRDPSRMPREPRIYEGDVVLTEADLVEFETYVKNMVWIGAKVNDYKTGHIVSCDIETRAGHIDCIGAVTNVGLGRAFLTPFINHAGDTMVAQHCFLPGTKKGLGFLSSIYRRNHIYWKEEISGDDMTRWKYCLKDCINTYEIWTELRPQLDVVGVAEYYEFSMRLWRASLWATIRGIKFDKVALKKLNTKLRADLAEALRRIEFICGHPLNPNSTAATGDLQVFLIKDMGLELYKAPGTTRLSTGKAAIVKLKGRYPWISPLVDLILHARETRTALTNFATLNLDYDGRMRASYNVAGTKTGRLACSSTAFDKGRNLQNWPGNLQHVFGPDEGMTAFEVDLAGADIQIVTWRADEPVRVSPAESGLPASVLPMLSVAPDLDTPNELKALFRAGGAVHIHNGVTHFGFPEMAEQGKKHPAYKLVKMGGHLINYGGKPTTLAKALGITVKEAKVFQEKYFKAYPQIKEWHKTTNKLLKEIRQIRSPFGMRFVFLGRVDGKALNDALAWEPQSTVARITNEGWLNMFEKHRGLLEVQLQVHDSLKGQFPTARRDEAMAAIAECMKIVVPFADPLVIGTECATSENNWGECK